MLKVKSRPCPKCKADPPRVRWHDGTYCYGDEGYDTKNWKVWPEHLHMTCQSCNYEWTTKTEDE